MTTISAAGRRSGESLGKRTLSALFRVLYSAQQKTSISNNLFWVLLIVDYVQLASFPLLHFGDNSPTSAAQSVLDVVRYTVLAVAGNAAALGATGAVYSALFFIAVTVFLIFTLIAGLALHQALYVVLRELPPRRLVRACARAKRKESERAQARDRE